MILIKQADVYSPTCLGKQDVLICGGKIEAVRENIVPMEGCQIIDGSDKIMIPGLIDQHVHITGGGGEGSFHTRAPEIQLSSLVEGGITTVVGLLGTDGITRSVENLVAKIKALNEEGISAYGLTGSYGYPSVTITGDIKKDIVFIQEILGVKLAISDHRAPNLTKEQLISLASDVRTASMISGKPGMLVLHMGDGNSSLSMVFEALEETSIPAKIFRPTHVSRTEKLLKDAFRLAKMGGYMDITAEPGKKGNMARVLRQAKEEGVPMEQVTISSDGQGSWSKYDKAGNLIKIGVSHVGDLYQELAGLVKEEGFLLEEVLPLATTYPSKALGLYPQKGVIAEGSDGDLLLLNRDLSLDTVMARGRVMMEKGRLLVKGTYED